MRQPGDLGLRRRLAGRLYPMTITIGVIIALGLQLTHWTLQTRALTETAQAYARHVAARRSETGAADAAGLGRLLPGTGVTRVSVADAGGRLLARWDDASAARASWWRSGEALGVAPLPSGGHVEVTLARGPLVGVTLLLLAVGLTAGIGLALLVYRVPLGAVGGMERRIEDLIAAAEQSNLELERRATEHQSFLEANLLLASTLDLEEVLGRLTEMTRSRLDVDVVRLWFREAHSGALVLQSQAGESWSEEAQHQRLAPGEGLTGWVLSERFPLALDDAQTDPRLKNRAWFTAEGIQSFLGVPLLVNETAVGILTCLSRTRRTWGTDEVSLAQALAALAALAVRNAQYHSASVRRSEELAALLRATRSVMEGLDLRVILERIVDEAAQIADTPHVMLLLADPEAPVLRIGAVAGDPVPPRFTASTTGTLPGLVATTGRPLHVADVRRDPRNPLAERDRRLGVVSYLGLPVRIRDRVLGVLTFRSVRPREYSPDEL
ncbi:MAG: GAF domain-containing protein, partial [Candidatus Rokubacteria bacterium]|nr:GAF domain-containing protein [Candidatus Rokubacteria bacterium]